MSEADAKDWHEQLSLFVPDRTELSKKSLGFSKAIKLPNEKRKNTQERRAQNVGEAKKHSERHFTQLVKDAECSDVLRDDPELVNFLEPLCVAACLAPWGYSI